MPMVRVSNGGTEEIAFTSPLFYTSTSSAFTYTHTNTNYTEALLYSSGEPSTITPTNCTLTRIGRVGQAWAAFTLYKIENLKNGSSLNINAGSGESCYVFGTKGDINYT